MGILRKPQSVAGQVFLLAVILADVGLLIWGWHLYQRRQEKLDGSGFNLAKPPEPEENPYAAMPDPVPVEDLEASMRLVIKESRDLPALGQGRGGAPPPASPAASAAAPAAVRPPPPAQAASSRSMRSASAEERRKVRKAKGFYYSLKNDPRFKNSKVLKDWKREFLSHDDLRAINAAYQKDRDPIKFMVNMVASPNFRGMFGKYMMKQEMRDFVQEMAGSAVVKSAADTFLADANLGAMAKHLGFAKDRMEGKNPESISALDGLRENEDYRNALER